MSKALLAYYVLLLGVVFVWPTVRLWRREQVNALVLPSDDTAEGVIGAWFKTLLGAIGLMLAAMGLGAPLEAFGDIAWLRTPLAAGAGWLLLGGSLVWMATAQFQMGRAWRIGIDPGQTATLARGGLFGVSRNPIFLGLRLNLLGLVLTTPNALTLAVALLGEALMQVQVRLEEEHLQRTFGDAYGEYRRRVPRWL